MLAPRFSNACSVVTFAAANHAAILDMISPALYDAHIMRFAILNNGNNEEQQPSRNT